MSCHHIEGVTCPACSSSRIEPVCLTCHPYPCTGHLTKMSIGVGADSHEIAALRVENAKLRWMLAKWEKFETAGDVNKWIEKLEADIASLKARLEAADECVEWLRQRKTGSDGEEASIAAYDALSKEAKP